jgi:hypothetical protein
VLRHHRKLCMDRMMPACIYAPCACH